MVIIKQLLKKIFVSKKYYFYFTISLISAVYFLFPIEIHTWESYWYASGIEGLFQVRSLYDFFIPGMKYPALNFNIYHPNHPLLHALSYIFYQLFLFFNIEIRAINIIQNINLVIAIIAIIFTYKIIYLLSKDYLFSSLLSLLLAFTDICWYYSFSGEVYIAPYSMMLVTFYLLLLIHKKLEEHESVNHIVILASITFSIALAFHLLVFPFCIVILYMLWKYNKTFPHFNFKLSLITGCFITILFICLFYILLPILIIDINSFDKFYEAIHIANPGSPLNITNPWKNMSSLDIIRSICMILIYKINSLLNSLIRTNIYLVIFYKIAISFMFLFYFIIFIKNKKEISY